MLGFFDVNLACLVLNQVPTPDVVQRPLPQIEMSCPKPGGTLKLACDAFDFMRSDVAALPTHVPQPEDIALRSSLLWLRMCWEISPWILIVWRKNLFLSPCRPVSPWHDVVFHIWFWSFWRLKGPRLQRPRFPYTETHVLCLVFTIMTSFVRRNLTTFHSTRDKHLDLGKYNTF